MCVFPNLFTSVSPLFSFSFFLIKEQSFLLLCNLKNKKNTDELWGEFCTFFLCKYWTFLSFIVVVNLK